jgi:uncharacterized metal-binding protein
MADGKTHARVATTVLVVGAATAIYTAAKVPSLRPLVVPFCLGLVNGLIVTPDIDIDQGVTHEEARWKRLPIVGTPTFLAFTTFWYPYSLVMPHRGMSHTLILGTATRFLYQFFWIIFWWATIMAWWHSQSPQSFLAPYSADMNALLIFFVPFFTGWCLQDVWHLVYDGRLRGRRKYRKPLSRTALFVLSIVCMIVFYLWRQFQ